MKLLVLSVALLLTGGSAAAMPCIGDYEEYREKLELMGFEPDVCPYNMTPIIKDDFPEMCMKNTSSGMYPVAFWKQSQAYADEYRAGRKGIGFVVLFDERIGFCVPPQVEFTQDIEDGSEPQVLIGSRLKEAIFNYIHPSRTKF